MVLLVCDLWNSVCILNRYIYILQVVKYLTVFLLYKLVLLFIRNSDVN